MLRRTKMIPESEPYTKPKYLVNSTYYLRIRVQHASHLRRLIRQHGPWTGRLFAHERVHPIFGTQRQGQWGRPAAVGLPHWAPD